MVVFLYLICAACPLRIVAADATHKGSSHTPPILDTKSFWRIRMTEGTDQVRTESGELIYYGGREGIKKKGRHYRVKKREDFILKHVPPEGWRGPEFDDSGWARLRGPFGIYRFRNSPAIHLRGKFRVTDPAAVSPLKLTATFQGGMVAYLNGREFARSHIAQGEIKPETPAQDYPLKAFINEKGHLLKRRGLKYKKGPDHNRYTLRDREITVDVPLNLLKKGVNVLALEIHRAPAPEVFYTGKFFQRRLIFKLGHLRKHAWWSRCGLVSLKLTGGKTEGIIPNAGSPEELRVWNRSLMSRIQLDEYGDICEQLRPVRICGAKNGAFSGQVVISSAKPIKNLKISVSDLSGPQKSVLPSSAVQIRYAVQDMGSGRRGAPSFNALEESPPAEVPVHRDRNGKLVYNAMQPVWFTVGVPRNAQAGRYTGRITVRADSEEDVVIPLALRVSAWILPDPSAFETHIDFAQSPESLSMKYSVPMWSKEHFDLIGRSMSLLGRIGNTTMYITMIRRTLLGNEHGMVRWIKKPDGIYEADLSIAEKYLDCAVRHMGKIPVVCLYCWESKGQQGGLEFQKLPRVDREILFTAVDPDTGILSEAVGPEWGTDECVDFWKPAISGMRKLLEERGMADSMMLGLCGDRQPTEQAMKALEAGAPGIQWVMHAHNRKEKLPGGRAVGYGAAIWGVGAETHDPDVRRGYGWKDPFRMAYIPRGLFRLGHGKILAQRMSVETWLAACGRHSVNRGVKGLGHMCADFWPVLTSGSRTRSLAGRYPEADWGALRLYIMGYYILGAGRKGPLATISYEMLRENIQECQARIFIERVLLDEKLKGRIGDALAQQAQDLLDQRIRIGLKRYDSRGVLAVSNLSELNEKLYETAAEISKKVDPEEQ
jgi:hypothetical protein